MDVGIQKDSDIDPTLLSYLDPECQVWNSEPSSHVIYKRPDHPKEKEKKRKEKKGKDLPKELYIWSI